MFNIGDPFIKFGFLTVVNGKIGDPGTKFFVLKLGRQIIHKPSGPLRWGLHDTVRLRKLRQSSVFVGLKDKGNCRSGLPGVLSAETYVAIHQADAQTPEFGHVTRHQFALERSFGAQQQDAELKPKSDVLGLRTLILNCQVNGSVIDVNIVVTNLSEKLTDEYHLRLGAGVTIVCFFDMCNPS